jgi:hypothetical protein
MTKGTLGGLLCMSLLLNLFFGICFWFQITSSPPEMPPVVCECKCQCDSESTGEKRGDVGIVTPKRNPTIRDLLEGAKRSLENSKSNAPN